ncbi:FtsK/SpoIIIE family DNA translocase [Robertkochia solimangrovi]|uniref:FtsK/SpoIIIE family DNA translocase n=1 Tax=Robertkochia solimangrovi TaxID=2213046 RepID=UPI0011816947|nr:DNA translocase FtsK [Robertkochia solimangrovi]TRZ44944.1 DNA translocase FtsK [Robertkochia solimangrovi]
MARKKTKKNNSSSTKKLPKFQLSHQQKIILGSLLMLFSIGCFIAFISFFSTWQEDQSLLKEFGDRQVEAENWLNKFGAGISHFFIYKGFGIASFIFLILLFQTGLFLFLNIDTKKLTNRWFWGVIIIIWLSIFLGFFASRAPLLGGTIGFEMNDFMRAYIGNIGIALLLFFMLITYSVLRLKLTPQKIGDAFRVTRSEIEATFATKPEKSINTENVTQSDIEEHTPQVINSDQFTDPDKTSDVDIENSFEVRVADDEEDVPEPVLKHSINDMYSKPSVAKNTADSDTELQMEVEVHEEKEESEVRAEKLVSDFGEFDPKLELSNYKFPPLDLLNDYGAGSITIDQEELEENKNRIVDTLKNYKIDISQIKATIGPTVTLYEIVPAAGVRISKIKNLEDDIALSLSALGIRIIAPIPGKGTIGIEVPNKKASTVSMRSVIASKKFHNAEMELPIAFGKTISNETFVVDLAKMPHLLMAGATGQGKSVGLNAMLTSLLYKKHPAEVKFVLVDPKKVELTLFNKIERHFLAKLPDSEDAIITDNTKVINTLNSLCIEMDNRYELLKNAMVRNIKEYNTKFKARKLNPNDGHQFLPYIVLVIDEFADLIMTAGKEVETPIARLAQLARAIGIHLIIATQRPSVNVITGIIKANFPARVAFRVTSKIDSRTILDSPGADQLIGRGDMLYTQGNDLTRLQCAFVDTPEVSKITDYIGGQRAYPDAHLLPEYVGEDSGTALDIDVSDRDALFREAAEVIVIAQQGSASLLQRKLKLGYNRAGRLIDQLEAAGIVGPFEGSKARQVLIPDMVALDQLLNNEN